MQFMSNQLLLFCLIISSLSCRSLPTKPNRTSHKLTKTITTQSTSTTSRLHHTTDKSLSSHPLSSETNQQVLHKSTRIKKSNSLSMFPPALRNLYTLMISPHQVLHSINQSSISQIKQWQKMINDDDDIYQLLTTRLSLWTAHQTANQTSASYAYQSINKHSAILQKRLVHPSLLSSMPSPNSSTQLIWKSISPQYLTYLLQTNKTQTGKIAVLLPLTGLYAKVGKTIQKVLQRLTSFFPRLKWSYFDTRGDRDYAVAALKKAVKQDVQLIMGPLGRWESLAIAPFIEWFEIPWFPLSTSHDLAKGNFTFHTRPTPVLEAQAIVKNLCETEIKTIAILHNDHHYGRQLAQTIMQKIRRCGIETTRRIGVKHTKQLQSAIIALSGRSMPYQRNAWWSRLNRKRKHPAHHSAPNVNYEGLVILLRGKNLIQAVSQLAWWDIEVKNHPDQDIGRLIHKYKGQVVQRVRLFMGLGSIQAAQSVVSASSFDYASMLALPPWSEMGEQFVHTYRTKYRRMPSLITQQLYDAFHWIQQSLDDRVRSRKDLRLALLNVIEMNGIWGIRTVSSSGLSLPKLVTMTRAQDYGIVEADEINWDHLSVPHID